MSPVVASIKAKLSDAVDVFEPLRTKRDFALASVYAMLFFHRRQTRKDDGEIESLEIAAEMTGLTTVKVGLGREHDP